MRVESRNILRLRDALRRLCALIARASTFSAAQRRIVTMLCLYVVTMYRLCTLTMMHLRSVWTLDLRVALPSRCTALAMQCVHVGTLPRYLIVTPRRPSLPSPSHHRVVTHLICSLPGLRIERSASSLNSIAASPRLSAPRKRRNLVAHAGRNAEALHLTIPPKQRQQPRTPLASSLPDKTAARSTRPPNRASSLVAPFISSTTHY